MLSADIVVVVEVDIEAALVVLAVVVAVPVPAELYEYTQYLHPAIQYSGSAELLEIIKVHKQYISKETLTNKLEISQTKPIAAIDFEIEGYSLSPSLEKDV